MRILSRVATVSVVAVAVAGLGATAANAQARDCASYQVALNLATKRAAQYAAAGDWTNFTVQMNVAYSYAEESGQARC
jgi:hypothetical protein